LTEASAAPTREQQRHAADHAGRDEAGVHELEQQAVDAEHQQHQHQARFADDGEEAPAPVGRQRDHGDVRRGQLHAAAGAGISHGDDSAVELAQQVVQVDGNEVDDLAGERIARRQADRLAHRLLGPGDVAAAQLGQAADVGGGVVDALGSQRVVPRRGACRRRAAGPAGRLRAPSGHRHADLDRRRGAQVGRRRHRRDVRGIQDVGAGARGPGALRRHEGGDRHRRGQDVFDDHAHRGVEPARGVHLQDDELGVLLHRPFQGAGDVLCRRRTDGAIDA
jgi:hypothetical protein